MFRTIAAALLAALANAGQPATSQLDPGSVILLSVRPPAEARPILASALTHTNPAVRLAAARVIAVNNDRGLAGRIAEALAVEQDDGAASEQVRALFLLDGGTALTTVDTHVARLGGGGALVLAEWLAQNQPGEFAKRLPPLAAAIPTERGSLVRSVTHAARQADVRNDVLAAWMEVAKPVDWQAVLLGVFRDADDFESSAGILIEGLRTPRPNVREDTVWFLVSELGRGTKVPAEVLNAALPGSQSTIDWETWGRELIGRRVTKAVFPDRSEFLRAQLSHRRLSDPNLLPLLTDREAALVRTAFPGSNRTSGRSAPGARSTGSGEIQVRTVAEWMPGVIATTAAAAGCRVPPSARFGFARVTYDERGRVVRTEVDAGGLPSECQPVLAALARTGLADADRPLKQGQQQWQVLPLSQSFVECTSRPYTTSVPVGADVGGDLIKTPRKVKDVRPQYPEGLQRQRVQGVVFAEAVIADSGCVRGLRVVKSSGALGLDIAAVQAVSAWAFEPAAAGGTPVAVHMTVSINFTVR